MNSLNTEKILAKLGLDFSNGKRGDSTLKKFCKQLKIL